MARPGKSAPAAHAAVAHPRGDSRSNGHARHVDAARPVSRVRSEVVHKGRAFTVPPKIHADVPYQTAIKNFEVALRAFQKQNYQKAADMFAKLVDSDARDVAERAHVHLRLCRQRTGRPAAAPKSAEDHYALGIACLNVRNLGQAVEHLSKADRIKPNQDHVQYALAALRALQGNAEAAFAHLQAAFTLRPENRIHARRDEDFHGLVGDPRFRRLIYPAESP